MFSRGNFTAKYKNYLRHAKALKERFQTENVTKLNDNVISRCKRVSDKLQQSKNDLFTPSTLSQRIKASICSAQDRLTSSPSNVRNSNEEAARISLASRLVKKPYFIGAGFLGIGAKPVTIEGYNAYDVEVLTQLGIVNKDDINVATNTHNNSNGVNDPGVNSVSYGGGGKEGGGGGIEGASSGDGGIEGTSSGGGGIKSAINSDDKNVANIIDGDKDGISIVNVADVSDGLSSASSNGIDGTGGALNTVQVETITKNHFLKSKVDSMSNQNDTMSSKTDEITSKNATMSSKNDTVTSKNDTMSSNDDTMLSNDVTVSSQNDILSQNDDKLTENIALSNKNDPLLMGYNDSTITDQNYPTITSQNNPTMTSQNYPITTSQNNPTLTSQNNSTQTSQNNAMTDQNVTMTDHNVVITDQNVTTTDHNVVMTEHGITMTDRYVAMTNRNDPIMKGRNDSNGRYDDPLTNSNDMTSLLDLPSAQLSNVDSPNGNSQNVFPESLSESKYTSIFENMPPESARNDIYTGLFNNDLVASFRNVFSFDVGGRADENKGDAVIEAMSQNFTVVKSEGTQKIVPEFYKNAQNVNPDTNVISETNFGVGNDVVTQMNVGNDLFSNMNTGNDVSFEANVGNDIISKTPVVNDAISNTNVENNVIFKDDVFSKTNVGNDVISKTNLENDVFTNANIGNDLIFKGNDVFSKVNDGSDTLLTKTSDLLTVQSEYMTPMTGNLTTNNTISNNVESIATIISSKINKIQPMMSNIADSVVISASNFVELFSSLKFSNDLGKTDSIVDVSIPATNISSLTQNVTITDPSPLESVTNDASASQLLTNIGSSGGDHSKVTASNEFSSVDSSIIVEAIPEPPAVPDAALEIASQTNALGEATFASLGLGGWTPVGIVQNCFEYLHVTLGIPWWEAIAIGTLIIRFCMFPLVIISQRNAAKMNNHLPQMQILQLKMTEARQTGNQMEAARYSQELMQFMKEKDLNPFKNMIVPLAQMPIFISFFVGLRQMANVPVDSLRTGGMLWFTDLTVPDQFFALPVITSFTLWATIELGTDSARLSSQNMQTMKYVLRALPVVILPFTVNFPGAILCYWAASNFISLAQVGFLKIPAVRDYFKIDPLIRHDPEKLPVKNKGFVGGIKDSWTNIKITKELEERRRLDDLQFHRAGKGPLVKTYKYDPTKPGPTISAKNR